jgi:CPA2 family monovalent cation:H+ antiporter-2
MTHNSPLISIIVGGLVLAFILGAIAHRFKLPPLIGYLVAGILVGPHTPGYVADRDLAPQLAEIGVILLMFGVGLHFSLKDLMSVRFIAVPGALAQIGAATVLGLVFGMTMGWPLGGSLVFGLALSCASTVVLLKAMQDRHLIDTERGKIAVGWLIVEDIAMVLALVLIPTAANISGGGHGGGDALTASVSGLLGIDLGIVGIVGVTLLKVAAFVGLMLVVGRRVIPWILHRIAHSGSRELFRLGVLAIALGVAFGAAELFGVSLALGAFFAGMILSESELSHRAAQESLPLRDAFAVLFFVSVGMMFNPDILMQSPLLLLATVLIIIIGKSIAAFLIVLLFRKPVGTALTISASLAQIGEFSFILAELGVGLDLLPEEGRSLILAGAIISIILNPLTFAIAGRLKPVLELRFPSLAPVPASGVFAPDMPEAEPAPVPHSPGPAPEGLSGAIGEDGEGRLPTQLTGHTVLVGYGRVGMLVAEGLKAKNIPFLVIDAGDQRVADARAAGIETIIGNAASAAILALANIPQAASIVIAIPESFEAGQVVEQARKSNPGITIIVRAFSDAEAGYLQSLGADRFVMGKREMARGLLKQHGLAAVASAAQ